MIIKSKMKNSIAGLLALIGTAMPFSSKAEETPKPYVQTTLASDYVSPSGSAVREAGRQDWASISFKGLTFGIFQNQFLGEKGISERDYCISYSSPLTSNLTGTVGFQYWDYPNGRFGNFDSAETAGLDYSGKINASLAYTHLNDNKVTENGERVHLKLSKPISLVEGKTKVSLTPSLATAWLDNFYGISGFSQASAGLNLGVTRGDWNLNLTATAQKALDSKVESVNWGTVSIGYQF